MCPREKERKDIAVFDKITQFISNRADHMGHKKKLVERINQREEHYASVSDAELRRTILRYKEEDHSEDSRKEKENLLVEVYAIVREASKRVLGLRHFDVQMLGGIFLNEGYISEMQTGEGKTLVATCPAVYNAVIGNKVHIITVNEYLSARDFQKMSPLYAFLGLSTGLVISNMPPEDKVLSYRCDIIYATNNELGFDYLRDNMKKEGEFIQGSLDYAIIDEVDSVLIDEARTPLIISGQAEDHSAVYRRMADVVKFFKEGEEEDFTRDKENKKLLIATDKGTHKVEQAFGIDNIYSVEHVFLLNVFNQALKAQFVFTRDKEYIVKDGEVVIVDDFTGRLMDGRRYSDGLHQAIEAKEGVEMKPESVTLATITFQNYFRMYKKLSGMTGTAKTEEKEFYSVYGMPVVCIPKNRPPRRTDHPDVVFHTKKAKFKAVVEKVKECYGRKQPILVGTTGIDTSEYISKLLLHEGIPHTVLNAKQSAEEANIIAQAGRLGAVTIATNMAGRGTDIITEEGVDELGGLFILGTEKHESRRIDNQLKGRTARQGAAGETQFYLSLEDDLFKFFGGERLMHIFEKFNMDIDDTPIESEYLTRTLNKSQRKIEEKHFDVRKHLLDYDDVLNEQRKVFYAEHKLIKDAEYDRIRDNLFNFITEEIKKNILDVYADPKRYPEEWDLKGLCDAAARRYNLPEIVVTEEIDGMAKDEMDDFVIDRFKKVILLKEKILGKEYLCHLLKECLFQNMDRLWTEQITNLNALQEGIGLRSYAQKNPLYEYKTEAYDMFCEMQESIKHQFVLYALGFQIRLVPTNEMARDRMAIQMHNMRQQEQNSQIAS